MSIKKVIVSFLHKIELDNQIIQAKKQQKKALRRLEGKTTINCVFFVLESSVWKYDRIYKIMSTDKRFNPIILVCPVVDYGKDSMIKKMEACYNFFFPKGYNVIKSYDKDSDSYFDARSLNPDIIFYTNPYKSQIDKKYYITNYLDLLTVYVPYFMNCSVVKGFSNNLPLHNLVWRKYVETEYEYKLAKKEQDRHGQNVVCTGYPGIELLIDKEYKPQSKPWKVDNPRLKRIIWAPHHTIKKSNYGHTCFLEYCDFMIDMVKKYEREVQFVFKPHPILKTKLELFWGKEKTDSYYRQWAEMPNSAIHEDGYVDLFLTSDAMIHDSGSFVVEYLYVNKPVMRTVNDLPLEQQFNEFGLNCLNRYYMGRTKEDIEAFIKNVINNVDPMKEERTRFINEELMPNGSPSQNVLNDIIDSIDNQILYR